MEGECDGNFVGETVGRVEGSWVATALGAGTTCKTKGVVMNTPTSLVAYPILIVAVPVLGNESV